MKNRSMKKRWKKYGAAGIVAAALALGACGQQDAPPESVQSIGIPLVGTDSSANESGNLSVSETVQSSSEDSTQASAPDAGSKEPESSQADGSQQAAPADEGGSSEGSALSQPVYIGNWEVTDYCYPSTPCGLSQLEVDALIGSELIYTPENFTCNRRVMEGDGFGYEFGFYDSLAEYEQNYSISVSSWFAGGDIGMVKCGYVTIEERIFGDNFVFMDEQPDKLLIHYYGVVFLAVREQAPAGLAAVTPRNNAYKDALNNLLLNYQLPLGEDGTGISETVYFAIQDIDGDGREELIINYQGSIMARIQEMVYDYDESKEELYREIWDFPDIQFYANGYARSDRSHNHSRSDFWPYNLYRYNSGTDQYELAYVVTAWDKELSETDAEGNLFPDAVDVSGMGRVYMVEDSAAGQASEPMDTADYEKWYGDKLGEYVKNNTVVVWQLLTEENLGNL